VYIITAAVISREKTGVLPGMIVSLFAPNGAFPNRAITLIRLMNSLLKNRGSERSRLGENEDFSRA
jgi:hypothetical protein